MGVTSTEMEEAARRAAVLGLYRSGASVRLRKREPLWSDSTPTRAGGCLAHARLLWHWRTSEPTGRCASDDTRGQPCVFLCIAVRPAGYF